MFLWSGSCQEEARHLKYCKNDSSCSSYGLLGIRKHYKSLEKDCLQISSSYLQAQEVQMHFVMGHKNKLGFRVHVTTRFKFHISHSVHNSSYQECYLIHSLQLHLTGSSALSKSARILANKPVNSGHSAGL